MKVIPRNFSATVNTKGLVFFFLSGFPFTEGNWGDYFFHSTLSLPPASDIYLQPCMWDDYHIFLIAPLVFTRLLLDEIYQKNTIWLIDDVMLVFVCLLDDLILVFCYNNLTRENGRLELASTITLELQANLLSKCTSHPKFPLLKYS